MTEFVENFKSNATPFLMFYTSDWIAATNRYTLEQRGFYSGVLFAMWERKGGLPDDARWLANALNCDPRTVRRLREFFIGEGKLESRDGHLVNRRMMVEIARYLRRKLPNSAPVREERSEQLEADFGPISARSSGEDLPDLRADLCEFPNEISATSDHILEARNQKPEEKKDSHPASRLEQDAACVRAGPSADDVVLDQVRTWFGDDERARIWITTHEGLYGKDLVRAGVSVVVGEQALGKQITQPVQLLASVIRRLDANRPAPGEQRPPAKGGIVPHWVADESVRGKPIADVLAEFYRQKAARMAAEKLEAAA